MNFLAHLWLADQTRTSLSGAVLGDVAHGADLSMYPRALEAGIRLHRRVDIATDRHPAISAVRARFAQGARRYAGIILDVVCDHVLARNWDTWNPQPLPDFCARAGHALAADSAWFVHAGGRAVNAEKFAQLLLSYQSAEGIDRALARIATRLKKPDALLQASHDWRQWAQALTPQFEAILTDVLITATADDPARAQVIAAALAQTPNTSASSAGSTISSADLLRPIK